MLVEQEEFREAIEELQNNVNSFVQYTDINQYAEISEMVERLNARLDECVQTAKRYNHHEYLFGLEITDYSQVQQCVKDFKPYSDLWTTVNTFYQRHNHWMNDEWETLNGVEIEEVVDQCVKTAAQVQRIFRTKDVQNILPVVDKIKGDVDHFKQFVRMAVALRKPGMTDRHWD